MGKRAIDYRREFRITPAMAKGTAVNVVTMVVGNMGNDSATGLGFTRSPACRRPRARRAERQCSTRIVPRRSASRA